MNDEELHLNLEDKEWSLTTIDHDRMIARANEITHVSVIHRPAT